MHTAERYVHTTLRWSVGSEDRTRLHWIGGLKSVAEWSRAASRRTSRRVLDSLRVIQTLTRMHPLVDFSGGQIVKGILKH